ncbi:MULTISPECIES: intradiol ring-cleavage dioxygenase [unclassified Rathayibacter]|uniref:intradiol ring-cleavage dioxygenase n=1 Tax=unclassified Rathayibacter TaxID=2609250 RepID=UPI000CE83920|nr:MULTISPECIES: intradiol ring-cleavage dioxygenase [unclassified Rathayibacter]PPF71567.1 3,4-dioxygenase subunit beta [Rathayibacter sp. AY1E6]PPH15567.1 3,4-dioxygenase subunit beta [Rathayibacter sp. AY1F8]PPH76880.1 3,4-dioxygenase subunit beta [Rathayibacter sp. AY1D4]PPH87138.1 3,4-dioxygenase subunit beta [Rathayibacter sp. AY1D3]
MTRIPEPRSTPDGPAYEGRRLDRPEEEVVDQGLPFDVGTLFSRRGVLTLVGAGAATLGLAACATGGSGSASSAAATATATPTATATAGAGTAVAGEIPDETAGPYPGDGSNGVDVLERSGIVRSDLRTSIGGGATADGVPLTLTLTILDAANGDVPFAGAAVYVWHCDAHGDYSMYSSGVEDETYLRGVQVADASGVVSFATIVPACYSGRWPHIHFEVYPGVDSITDASNAIATSQVALQEEACTAVYALDAYAGSAANLARVGLDTDSVFGDDGGALQLATMTGSPASGYSAALTASVDTRTAPTAGAAPRSR